MLAVADSDNGCGDQCPHYHNGDNLVVTGGEDGTLRMWRASDLSWVNANDGPMTGHTVRAVTVP